MKVIGIGHRSGMGKDTFAKYLATALKEIDSKTKVKIVSFAGILKDHFYELYKWTGIKPPIYYEENRAARDIIIPHFGKTIVDCWVLFGEAVRLRFPDAFAEYAVHTFTGTDVVIIPDTRHFNELDAIHGVGGSYYKVHNPRVAYRVGPSIDHIIEDVVPDVLITNDSTLQALYAHAQFAAQELLKK